MLFVKHRTASGSLDELWEFDPARRVVMLTVRQGAAAPVHVDIPIASRDRPRPFAWVLARSDEQTWEVLPHRYGVATMRPVPIHEALGSQSVVLCAAPPEVSEELEAL